MIYKKKKTEKIFRPCDFPECPNCGEFKAPKDRTLKEYYLFCLEHVKQYNKNWNFYQGLSSEEIEQHIQNDTTWQRPTWKLGQNQTIFSAGQHPQDSFGLFNEAELGMSGTYNPPRQHKINPNSKLARAAKFLEVDFPLNVEQIKSQFKKLAKKYHPDKNKGNKESEQLFKELIEHYRYLLKQLGEIK